MSFEIVEEAQRRHSSLGSLVMAVLVGLLSLGANEYARVDPQQVGSMFTTVFTSAEVNEPEPAPVVNPIEAQLNDLRPQLDELEGQLGEHFAKRNSRRQPSEELAPLLQQLEALTLDQAKTLELFADEERLTVMRLLFMASEFQPDTFAVSFRELNRHVIESETGAVSAKADMLRIYHDMDFANVGQRDVMNTLSEFHRRYPRQRTEGVQLCAMVGHELSRLGYADMADRVLRYGINRYTGHPGVSRLVNQLIDQQERR